MRTHIMLAALGAALGLSACAATGPGPVAQNSYAADVDRLDSQCNARGGILQPLGAGGTGQASTDYFCDIHGGGTRLDTGPTGALTTAP